MPTRHTSETKTAARIARQPIAVLAMIGTLSGLTHAWLQPGPR